MKNEVSLKTYRVRCNGRSQQKSNHQIIHLHVEENTNPETWSTATLYTIHIVMYPGPHQKKKSHTYQC